MRRLRYILVAIFALCSSLSHAESHEDAVRFNLIKAVITDAVPGIVVKSMKPSALKGLYEVTLDGGIVYATPDGKFFLQGDLLSIVNKKVVNHTELAKAETRKALLDTIDSKKMISFKPKGKSLKSIIVFTDVECGFCQKLHLEVPELNAMGITVNYVPYPRAGTDSSAGDTMRNAWCSRDKQSALTTAKAGGSVAAAKKSCKAPIQYGFELGQQLGVQGTPAIYTESGEHIGGFLTAQQFKEKLFD